MLLAPGFAMIPMEDAELWLQRAFIASDRATDVFDRLMTELDWAQGTTTLFGRTCKIPRMQAWYGDAGMSYAYSGMRLTATPWTRTLDELRRHLQRATSISVNSVLANLYRDGGDGVGWHSDDEHGLGKNPVIASLSFGATRCFQLRHRRRRDLPTLKLDLEHGSLLVMAGTTQSCWHHQIPKTRRPVGPRINLTFRHIREQA